jgi:uncharacterized protein YbbK (DUF523 family)
MNKIPIGVSACLIGQKTRYDGRHKNDNHVAALSQWFEFVPVCPEFELGLGVPRETMRLEGDPQTPRLVTAETRKDQTGPMLDWCAKRLRELESTNLHGFIFKSKSPSCGLERIDVFPPGGGASTHQGQGLFAYAFMQHFPHLPVIEEISLRDPALRERFIESALSYPLGQKQKKPRHSGLKEW